MLKRALIALVALLGAAAVVVSGSGVAREITVPTFTPDVGTGWIMDRSIGDDFLPPASGPGPITFDKAHPYVPNGRTEQASFRVADLSNPILQPWTIPPMRRANEDVLKGKYAFTAKSC